MLLNILIEILSLYIFTQQDYFTQNFSEFFSNHILIGIGYGILISLSIYQLFQDRISKKIIIPLSCIFTISFMIPYHINDFLNQLHSLLAAFSIIIVLYMITYRLKEINHSFYYIHLAFLLICVMIFIHFTVINSILELLVISYIQLLCILKKCI